MYMYVAENMCIFVPAHTGTQEDVELAVDAASKAFESWSKLPGHVRARHLYSIARHVQKHARLESVESHESHYYVRVILYHIIAGSSSRN